MLDHPVPVGIAPDSRRRSRAISSPRSLALDLLLDHLGELLGAVADVLDGAQPPPPILRRRRHVRLLPDAAHGARRHRQLRRMLRRHHQG